MLIWCRGEPQRLRLGYRGRCNFCPEGEVDRVAMYDPLYVEACGECIVYGVRYWLCSVINFLWIRLIKFVELSFCGLCMGSVYFCASVCYVYYSFRE